MAAFELLLDGSRDRAEQILALCTPTELARLSCTSRSLRSVVAGLPEALWHVRWSAATFTSALGSECGQLTRPRYSSTPRSPADITGWVQAAARHTYPAHHPVLRAPSVQAWLRRQHSAHAALAAGLPQAKRLAHSLISPDFRQDACREGSQLHIRDLATGAIQHVWTLPVEAAALVSKPDWGWAQEEGAYLVQRYAAAWGLAARADQ